MTHVNDSKMKTIKNFYAEKVVLFPFQCIEYTNPKIKISIFKCLLNFFSNFVSLSLLLLFNIHK